MAAIDLVVLGMLKKGPLSAYELQKQVEYRNISRWVKISTPSIYKKVLQLEEQGYLKSHVVREGKMPEKAVYSLTREGEAQFEKLMLSISSKPVRLFLDFNAVIVNLDSLPPSKRSSCLDEIEKNVQLMKLYLSQNLEEKKDLPDIPANGLAVLKQQWMLAETIEEWLRSLRENRP